MADTTSQQPYQFGDVVDGYRWTITGWEPVTAPPRTVGVPRLLADRYAATQQAQARAREELRDSDSPDDVESGATSGTAAAEEAVLDLDAVLNRRVVAAPDLVVEFHEPEVAVVDDPWAATADDSPIQTGPESDGSVSGQALDPVTGDPAASSAAASQRSWYGLGWETVGDDGADDDSDAPFAAALALGARTLAEQHEPSDIEIAAGLATAASRGEDSWRPVGWDQIDEWTGSDASDLPTVEPPLDPHALAYSASDVALEPVSAPIPQASTEVEPQPEPEPTPEPRVVTYTPEPPAGWYPGAR